MPAHPRGRSRCRAACPRFTGADSIETRREVSDHSEEEESRQQEEGEKDEEGEEIGSLLSYWLARGDTVTPLPFSCLTFFARIDASQRGGAREFVADLEER